MESHFNKSHGSLAYFLAHPVFTHDEFLAARVALGGSSKTVNALLHKHLKSGRLVRVQRGLYASVPGGTNPSDYSPDPYLVSSKLRPDAVVAYHSALAFHGKAHSTWRRFQYLTADRPRAVTFRGLEFVGVQAPLSVRRLPDFGGGVVVRPHAGGEMRVATLERCLVDVLHSPEQGGGWEELWRSLEMVEFYDLTAVVEYTLRLESALTAARVGFFLDQHRAAWMVEEKHLAPLLKRAPAEPRYLDSRRVPGKLVPRWNLIVPADVLERRWEEPA